MKRRVPWAGDSLPVLAAEDTGRLKPAHGTRNVQTGPAMKLT